MPGKARFGQGSMLGLGPVAPLPDDDEDVPVPQAPPAAPEPQAEPPAAPVAAVDAAASERARKGPPSTLRVNDTAGAALWEAFLVAKSQDPFLSFRQFTSHVVMDGLDRAAKRAARRS